MTLANPATTVRASSARVRSAASWNQVAMTAKAGSYRTAAMTRPTPAQMA
jgi:hypothetical protein